MRDEASTLLGFFRRLGASAPEAEDLAQDVFLKLYRHSRTYRADERFVPFVFRVARNAWVDRSRRRQARPTLVEPPRDAQGGELEAWGAADERSDAEADAAARRGDETRRMLEALDELAPGHREVFELGAMQELSYQEVGELLGIPVGTVKSRMFHAVRRLREALGADEEVEA